ERGRRHHAPRRPRAVRRPPGHGALVLDPRAQGLRHRRRGARQRRAAEPALRLAVGQLGLAADRRRPGGGLQAPARGRRGPRAAAHAGTLRAGVGRADVTPPTGYYMMGWVTSEAKPVGVWTRLFARAIVLEENGRKTALVAMDANGIPGGLLAQVADDLKARGF